MLRPYPIRPAFATRPAHVLRGVGQEDRMTQDARIAEVLSFWRAAGREKWFAKDDAFDAEIALRFMALHDAAARGELDAWESGPEGALALALLLDQFPRNMFRGSARAFATDGKALGVVRRAILAGLDQSFDPVDRQFFYLPFMHAETLADQDVAVKLYEALGDAEALRYAHIHRDAIARFGRFPHRNALLGRETTADEESYLADGGFKG
jgi:uncharacterized protein (DUF924 family)